MGRRYGNSGGILSMETRTEISWPSTSATAVLWHFPTNEIIVIADDSR